MNNSTLTLKDKTENNTKTIKVHWTLDIVAMFIEISIFYYHLKYNHLPFWLCQFIHNQDTN